LQPFDAVFEGDVVGWATEVRSYPVDSTRTLSYYEAVVKIAIRRQWKGTPSDTVVIRTALEGAMCASISSEPAGIWYLRPPTL
jgi:hypothetical protein